MTFGFNKLRENIELSDNADYTQDLQFPFTAPVGTQVWLVWSLSVDVRWDAIMDGDMVRWRIPKALTTSALVPDRTLYTMYARYPDNQAADGYTDHVWYVGQAVRTGY